MITNVYIDGFNLYFRCVRHTPYKWLNLAEMSRLLFKRHTVHRIRYFTALVTTRQDDPDQLARQQVYLRALSTIPNLHIHLGTFSQHRCKRPLASSSTEPPQMVEVIDQKEKGSDVNLATYLLVDGFRNDCEQAVVVSGDADLIEPIRMVRAELGLRVVLVPTQRDFRKLNRKLLQAASCVKRIRENVLFLSQFPPVMSDANGTFSKPTSW
ncbi:MAG: NYN domain-containing protein [Anaerolineae bacterium]